MKVNLTLVTAALAVTGLAGDSAWGIDANSIAAGETPAYTTPVGAAAVDAGRLHPYLARWSQEIPGEDGKWIAKGGFEERLEIDEQGHWRHTQITLRNANGIVVTGARTLDRKTLQPLRFERQVENAPPTVPVEFLLEYEPAGYAGEAKTADGTVTQVKRALDLPMFDGSIIGLVIAALPLEDGYHASLPTVIPSLKATYWLEARVVGRKTVTTTDGSEVETWEVKTEWYNIDDKAVYPGGRDQSGGAYYIAVKPGDGEPFVVEYASNGVRITWDGERDTDR